MEELKGLIYDIQGHSVHDGPGCRTLVFLNGCALRCAWCSNPEGQLPRPRVLHHRKKCVHTHYRCIDECPNNAIQINGNGTPHLSFNRFICDRCDSMKCVNACLNEALSAAGRHYSVSELMRILKRDQSYWGRQGGVTFTGGEPLLQKDFILSVLKQCRSNFIHTAIETSAHVHTDVLMEALKWTDWMFVDIKHMNSKEHGEKTGTGNELILKNLEAVAMADWDGRLIIRLTIIPGFNDTQENLKNTATLMQRLNLKEVNLLPFHRIASSKYEQLSLNYAFAHLKSPSKKIMLKHRRTFEDAGLQCYVDFETPF